MVQTKAFYNGSGFLKLEGEINRWLTNIQEKEPTFHLISINTPSCCDALATYYVETEKDRERAWIAGLEKMDMDNEIRMSLMDCILDTVKGE